MGKGHGAWKKDKSAFGEKEFKDFSLMMYSDFMKCQPKTSTQTYFRLLPQARFGPLEKSYYTE